MEVNLGAIAKGYISDKVKEYLLEKGINRAIINLGGNVLVIGNKQDGSDFKIGIQDPDGKRGKYLGAVNVSDKSVVSSGTYERYFVHEGKAYHHIFNPFTGFPQENRLKGVIIYFNGYNGIQKKLIVRYIFIIIYDLIFPDFTGTQGSHQ